MAQQTMPRPTRGDGTRLSPLGPAPYQHAIDADAKLDASLSDMVDLWGRDSFPASDPPANW